MPKTKTLHRALLSAIDELSIQVDELAFDEPTTHVYNPLRYARAPVAQYLKMFATRGPKALWLGMNPGPWGMAQTGIPFGEIGMVRDWMGIDAPVEQPRDPHPKRPITGLDCERSEVSGRRLYGWAEAHFGTAKGFFAEAFVWNYCPLVFMEASGKNRTPDKLSAAEREPLFAACDESLRAVTKLIEPKMIIGVGKFAEACAKRVLGDQGIPIGTVLHPSPASPMANRGWAEQAERQLSELGFIE
jgi:single-strand selective monofunctional uracil DNA glycosylase